MHYLHIIHSKTANRFYVGETYNISQRLAMHNDHYYSESYTKMANDWEVSLVYSCENEKDAKYLEKFIKRMKSRAFIEKIILAPSILKDILEKSK